MSGDVHKYAIVTNQSKNLFHRALRRLWSHETRIHSPQRTVCDWRRHHASLLLKTSMTMLMPNSCVVAKLYIVHYQQTTMLFVYFIRKEHN